MNSPRITSVVICFVWYFAILGVIAKPPFNNTESPEDRHHTDQPNIFALVENENLHARRTSNIPIMADGFQTNDTNSRSNGNSTDDEGDALGVSDDVDDSSALDNREDIDGSHEDDINVPRDASNGTDGNSSESQDDRLNEQDGGSDGTDDLGEFRDGNFENADGEFIGDVSNNTWMVNDNFLAFEEDRGNHSNVNITGNNDTSILGRRRFRPFRPRPPFRPPPRHRPDGGHRFDSNQGVHAGSREDFLHAKLDIQAGSKESFIDASQGVHESGGRWDDRFRSGKGQDSDDDPERVSDDNKRHGSGHNNRDRFDSNQNVHAGGPGGFLDASQNVHGSKDGGHRERFDSNQNVHAGGPGGFLDASQNVHGSGHGHRDRFESSQDINAGGSGGFLHASQNVHASGGQGHRDRIDASQNVHASGGHGHRDRIDASQNVHASSGHGGRFDANQNIHAGGSRDRNQHGHTPYGKYLSNSMNILVAQSISIGGRRRTQIAVSGPAFDFLTIVLKSLVDIADHVGEKCFSLLTCLIGANEDDRLNNLGQAVSTFHRMIIPLQRGINGTSSIPYTLGVSSKSESTCEKNYTGCDQIQKYIKSFLK